MMRPRRAYLLQEGHGKLGHEEQLVAGELARRGVPVDLFTPKRIRRRQLALDAETLVVGDTDSVYGALKQLGVPLPVANPYPSSLAPFMHRRAWRSTLGQVLDRSLEDTGRAVFVKPADREKRFTGCVVEPGSDESPFHGVSRRLPVLCAERVSWRSEHRVYVVRSEVRAICHYDGDPEVKLDPQTLTSALDALDRSQESRAGYAIDFGVLDSGETALVEMNDGFAIGAYQIAAVDYTDMLIARWEELVTGAAPSSAT